MYEGVYRDRAYPGGVYSLKQGTKLMDFIIAVHGLYCEDLLVTPIIPTRYGRVQIFRLKNKPMG